MIGFAVILLISAGFGLIWAGFDSIRLGFGWIRLDLSLIRRSWEVLGGPRKSWKVIRRS